MKNEDSNQMINLSSRLSKIEFLFGVEFLFGGFLDEKRKTFENTRTGSRFATEFVGIEM